MLHEKGAEYFLVSGTGEDKEEVSEFIHQQLGVFIEAERFVEKDCRDLDGEESKLYLVSLTKEEIDWIKSKENIPHGKEKLFMKIISFDQIINKTVEMDWGNLGKILSIYAYAKNDMATYA